MIEHSTLLNSFYILGVQGDNANKRERGDSLAVGLQATVCIEKRYRSSNYVLILLLVKFQISPGTIRLQYLDAVLDVGTTGARIKRSQM